MYKQGMGNTKHISLDDVCYLVSVDISKDDLMQDIETDIKREVFCSVLNINGIEFAKAVANGLKPQLTFVVDYEEYNNEPYISYNDSKYAIYRSFVRYDGYIELHCESYLGVK